jgi:hypothetical protein
MYTIEDYKKILNKQKDIEFLSEIKEEVDGFVKIKNTIKVNIYKIFKKYLKNFQICMEK